MLVRPSSEVPTEVVEQGACGTTVKWLVGEQEGAPNFYMRLFELAPGGSTPLHEHPWDHEVFILDGEGALWDKGEERPFQAGDAIFVAPNERHQFRNTADKPLKFLCLIPSSGVCGAAMPQGYFGMSKSGTAQEESP